MDANDGTNCYFSRLDGTVPAIYEAHWSSAPGWFTTVFYGQDQLLEETGWGTCAEVTRSEMESVGAGAPCEVPDADTAAKRRLIQAVVATCSTTDTHTGDGQTVTATETWKIRMRRTVCDNSVDTDGDDLSDCTEFALNTETHNPDTDGDGLTDGVEVLEHGTDPRKPDTDGDGVDDGPDHCKLTPGTTDNNGCPPTEECKDNQPPTLTAFASPNDWREGRASTDPQVEVLYSAAGNDPDGPLTDGSYAWVLTDSAGTSLDSGQALFHWWTTGEVTGARTAKVTVTDACGASATRTLQGDITGDPVVDFAPTMRLHPQEEWWPMTASSFLNQSSLRFVREKGFPRADDDFRVVGRGDINPNSLGSGAYAARTAGKTYKSDDSTRPYDETNAGPNSKSGFYLDLNDDYRDGTAGGNWPVYVQIAGSKIVYWLFYAYSQPFIEGPEKLTKFGHEGDWERVVVDLDENLVPDQVGFVAHHEPVNYSGYLGDQAPDFTTGMMNTAGFSPIGYVALGGHGTYPTAGMTKTCDPVKGCLADYRKRGGVSWDTGARIAMVTGQGWFGTIADHVACEAGQPMPMDSLECGFGGAWGHRGSIADLTGPQGPSAYKPAAENHN